MQVELIENRPNRTKLNQGMNWISQHKRLAIYMRDGFSCAYCCASILTDDNVKLTLDHIIPYSKGGKITDETNLVTCCKNCNDKRGNRSVEDWICIIAMYTNVNPIDITQRLQLNLSRSLDIATAKSIVLNQGSCAKAIQHTKINKLS